MAYASPLLWAGTRMADWRGAHRCTHLVLRDEQVERGVARRVQTKSEVRLEVDIVLPAAKIEALGVAGGRL